MCLGRMALISKGQEQAVSNDGIMYVPPEVSKMCYDQYMQELNLLQDMMNK